MLDDIKVDFNRYCQVDYGVSAKKCKNKIRVWFNSYGLQVLTTQRLYRWTQQKSNFFKQICKLPLMPISFFLHKIAERLYDIKISLRAIIEPGCYIGHFGGIRIGVCQIGRHCNINHQVEIGSFSHEDSDKPVKIDDQVWIGAHSKIMEGVCIRKGVAISAGTIVSSDILENMLVTGSASRIVKYNYNNSFLLMLPEQEKYF